MFSISDGKRQYGVAITYGDKKNFITTMFKTIDKGYEEWVDKSNKKGALATAPYPQSRSSVTESNNVSQSHPLERIVKFLKNTVNKKDFRVPIAKKGKLQHATSATNPRDTELSNLDVTASNENVNVRLYSQTESDTLGSCDIAKERLRE